MGDISRLFVGRDKSVQAVKAAMTKDKQILLVKQRHGATDDPNLADLEAVGTVSTITELVEMPGLMMVVVECTRQACITGFHSNVAYLEASVIALSD